MAKESAAADPQPLVARLYAMNTLGSVIGTICGSFLLIPLMGTRGAMVLLAWLSVPAALFLIYKWPGPQKIRFATIAAVTAVLAGTTVLAAPPGFYKQMFARRFGNVLWFSEGISETVAICEHADKSAWIHYSDGRGASGTTSFRGGWLYAHVPLLLHPDPHSALVICFGTGNTLGAARLHPLEQVDGVELSTEVPKASVFFKETNHDVANNPNVRLVIEDGRNYLLGNNQSYDVITEEPPLLHTAGVVNLYSKDFYQLCARRLTENGIMAVWLATWELEDRDVRMLVRAFVEAFPYASAWDSRHLGEWILVGSKKPLAIDPVRMKQRMAEPILARDLAIIGIRSPGDLLALYMKGDDFLRSFTRDVPPVTDDRSVVDFTTPREARANYGLGDWLTGGFNVSGVGPSGLVSELRVRDFDAIYTSRERPDALIVGTDQATRASLVKQLAERIPQEETLAGRKMAWNVMACASDYMELHQPDKSFQILEWGMGIVGRVASADLFAMQASLYKQTGRLEAAKDSLQRALAIDPANAKALKLASELK
jgi:spermidine synthase